MKKTLCELVCISIIIMTLISCSANKIYNEENVSQLEVEDYLQKLEETEEYHLIDVRTLGEYRKNHLDGAINISYIGFNFNKKIKELDPEKPVFLMCQTAHRSPFAAKRLRKKGFKEIYDLKGGFKEYLKYQGGH